MGLKPESRKVQKVGTSTLSVSLPHEWTQRANVGKGDLLIFEDLNDGSMRLSPSTLARRRGGNDTFVIDADAAPEKGLLERLIVGNYVIGRNHIVVASKKRIRSEHLVEVRRSVDNLVGLGIMLETPERIELQCSLDSTQFPIETIIKRLHAIGATMQKEAVDALVQRDARLAHDARSREREADKVYRLALRLLLTAQVDPQLADAIGIRDQLPIIGNRLVCKNLENVADYADHMALHVIDLLAAGAKFDSQVLDAIRDASDLAATTVSEGLACIFVHNPHRANAAIEAAERVDELERAIHEQLATPRAPAVMAATRGLTWGLRRIAENGGEIAVVSINRFLEHDSAMCRRVPEGAAASGARPRRASR